MRLYIRLQALHHMRLLVLGRSLRGAARRSRVRWALEVSDCETKEKWVRQLTIVVDSMVVAISCSNILLTLQHIRFMDLQPTNDSLLDTIRQNSRPPYIPYYTVAQFTTRASLTKVD
jgi:hypothetical protein